MIFLESPVGLGYSENRDIDRESNHNSTVIDIYTFLKEFY